MYERGRMPRKVFGWMAVPREAACGKALAKHLGQWCTQDSRMFNCCAQDSQSCPVPANMKQVGHKTSLCTQGLPCKSPIVSTAAAMWTSARKSHPNYLTCRLAFIVKNRSATLYFTAGDATN